MSIHWKSHFWRNIATNYLRTFLRVAAGILVFRLLIQHFTDEEFGYWSLLWSVFGYTILLDFGLGFTAQREVAKCGATGEWTQLNRILSTMVWTFLMIGALILIVFILIKPFFLNAIHTSQENRESFTSAYWIFFTAIAFGFPLGIFPEILVGLHRRDLANWAVMISTILNLLLVYIGISLKWSLSLFVFIGVVTTLAPNVMCFFTIRRLIPQLSLSPRLFDLRSVKAILSFSMISYFIILTNVIITRTSQTVISLCIGVASVKIFQMGYKASEIFGLFTNQLQTALVPAAAHLHAKGDQNALNELLIKSTRLIVLLATPAYALSTVYLTSLIQILTGIEKVDPQTYWTGQILLLNTYYYLLTTSCAKRILNMGGCERPLLRLSIINASLNLVLSITLVFKFGVVGVAIGTFIPSILTNWLWFTPLMLKFTSLSLSQWLRAVYYPVLRPIVFSLAILIFIIWTWPTVTHLSIFSLFIRSICVMIPIGIYFPILRKELL